MDRETESTSVVDDELERMAVLQVARSWPVLMVMGVITVAIGVIIMAWPSETLVVLSVLFGIQLLVLGLFRLVSAFSGDVISPGLSAFAGILLMIGGVVVLRHPFGTVEVLATILGVVWIVSGSLEAVDAIGNPRRDHRVWHVIGGVLSLVAGIVVVAWPKPTITVVAWIGGIQLVIFGVVLMITALAARKVPSA